MATATVRRLTNADRNAILEFLAPTESISTFLIGNARERSIDDTGAPIEGVWLGAFEGSRLCGLIGQFRGPQSWVPACDGHADVLVPAMVEAAGRPRVIVGERTRVDEVMQFAPSGWLVEKDQREVLLVMRWERFVAPGDVASDVLTPPYAAQAAELIDQLHRDAGLPTDREITRGQAERLAREERARVRSENGALVAMSCESAATGRFVHVGATVCAPAARRRGHATACVASVVMHARESGRASEGAVLFTGEDNAPAIAMYERLGFRREALYAMRYLRTR